MTLGVPSIATSSAPDEDPTVYIRLADPAAAALDGVVSVDDESEIDVEEVARLRPDLIVGGDFDGDGLYERLERIAPTVVVPDDLPNGRFFGVQRFLAELTGRTAELERLHSRYDQRVAALRERYRRALGRAGVDRGAAPERARRAVRHDQPRLP